jgi:cobalt/nickel transport system ATP-binding protein
MADPQPVTEPIIRLINYSFQYADGTSALEDINLEVDPGETLAIIGPNGAGKSTLLLCLMGLLQGGGQIFIAGQELTPKSAQNLRRRMAMVFQDPDDQLFMPVLEEDVAFGPANLGLDQVEVNQRVEAALGMLHLLDKRRHAPHHLSFGEKRRAALATALAMQTDLLFLDEPTSNLDPATRHELTEYLGGLNAARIVATHDLVLVKNLCTRCILLSGGRQIAGGPTEEILSNIPLLRQHRMAAG